MNHIFISYHHHECDFAACLRMEVEALGLDTWIDKRKLRAGDDWRNEIDNGIKNAVALIVVMTPEARASDYVTYEWAFALGYGIKVIPIMLKTTPLHPRLDVLQYIDFTNQQRELGHDVRTSLLRACPVRLRPILMTSIATVAAAVPPALAIGPGAETRIPMAITIIGGVIMSTLLTLFVVPCVYSLFSKIEKKQYKSAFADEKAPSEENL